ncbi:MAG: GGDEF domain-containing protein [Bacillota bacterium]
MYHLDIETNIISIMMLFTLYFSLHKQVNKQEFINRIFITLLCFNALILFIDSFQISFNGNSTVIGGSILGVSTFFYYFLNPIIPLIWIFYIDLHIFKEIKRLYKIFYITLPLLLVHLFFLIMSTTGNYIYYIDASNNYARGNLFWITPALTFGLVFVSLAMIIINRTKIKKNEVLPFLLFAVPPTFAGVIQIAVPGLSIIWPSVTISILIVYIYIQSKLTITDYLTGLFNRREYDNCISILEHNKNKNYLMGGIAIDIDNFKNINDSYGHSVGDQALINLSSILKASVRQDDFVARVGGDEFTIIVFNSNKQTLVEIVDRIEENMKILNSSGEYPYQMILSIGYDIYLADQFESIEKFFIHLDRKMYESKRIHKEEQ